MLRLPDDDFTVAPIHKMIPSAIGVMEIKEKTRLREVITYSGPEYVAVRSAKLSQSSVVHHLEDMKRIHSLDDFSGSLKNKGNDMPLMIVTIDVGPDKIPRT